MPAPGRVLQAVDSEQGRTSVYYVDIPLLADKGLPYYDTHTHRCASTELAVDGFVLIYRNHAVGDAFNRFLVLAVESQFVPTPHLTFIRTRESTEVAVRTSGHCLLHVYL